MDSEKLRKDANSKWESLPWEIQEAVARMVHERTSVGGDANFNFTGFNACQTSIATMRHFARTVGHPHVRMVNGENYFSLSENIVSVIVRNRVNQLTLF